MIVPIYECSREIWIRVEGQEPWCNRDRLVAFEPIPAHDGPSGGFHKFVPGSSAPAWHVYVPPGSKLGRDAKGVLRLVTGSFKGLDAESLLIWAKVKAYNFRLAEPAPAAGEEPAPTVDPELVPPDPIAEPRHVARVEASATLPLVAPEPPIAPVPARSPGGLLFDLGDDGPGPYGRAKKRPGR